MKKRIIELSEQIKLSDDFHVRERGDTVVQAFILLLSAFTVAITIYYIRNQVMALSVVLVIYGTICVLIAKNTNINREYLKITEYQSALFASALGMNSDFTLIVSIEKLQVFYFDYRSQSVFESFCKQESRDLDSLLQLSGISEENSKTIRSLVGLKNEQNIIIDIDVSGEIRKVAISIAPIPRPKGFAIINGRFL